ncbi:hypothetical protein Trco_008393 [Trichoderma cornu-damae]|uniref:Uncharacterized protein n=1 Tax=Trichoderma cornu-damae TaxID=654480 RepID=A0A9P8QIL0_9HYPO|nr:hypothetical protein Trco_008393 [Trichoderma cornu-damae]
MFFDDLLYIRAHMSTGVNHPKVFSPDNNNSHNNNNNNNNNNNRHSNSNRHSVLSGSRPVSKSANCDAGVKMPMNVV